MARKPNVLTNSDIDKMEGWIQQLVDTDAKFRPKAQAIDYIAQKFGTSARIVREWVKGARPLSRQTAITGRFFCAYERIAELLVEQLESTLWTTATTTGGRDSVKAALYLLPRVHPERYGDVPEEVDDSDVLNIADVEQEVFDAMSVDDLEKLERWQEQIMEVQEKAQMLIKTKRAKVLAAATAEDPVH